MLKMALGRVRGHSSVSIWCLLEWGQRGGGGGVGRSRSEKLAWALEAKDKALGATTKSRRLSREEPCSFLNPSSQFTDEKSEPHSVLFSSKTEVTIVCPTFQPRPISPIKYLCVFGGWFTSVYMHVGVRGQDQESPSITFCLIRRDLSMNLELSVAAR